MYSHIHMMRGNVLTVTDALNDMMSMAYDNKGRLRSVADAEGGKTECTYDKLGNQLTSEDPPSSVTENVCDDNNHVTSPTNALGETATLTYDKNDRLISGVNPDGGAFNITVVELIYSK